MADDEQERFLGSLQALSGVSLRADLERMARAVLSVLLEELPVAERGVLLAGLPTPLRALPAPGIARPSETLDAFYERVASRGGVELGQAVEHSQNVCRVLAGHLRHEARHRLVSCLPDAVSTLLALPESAPFAPTPAPRPGAQRSHEPSHTLASGKAGSRKPVAEAAPPAAHAHSVARSDEPHADTKLSTSHGATQEREEETLASGQPGSERPIDEGG